VRQGYQVLTATDGRQAIEVARRDKPDMLLLDIMLPGLDG
jgi:DNA-binding response OmpR family regulator